MGITQQIGASSLIKPGVIDNTAARPASPYEGQVIFQKDTDQLLVWNGTAWVIPNSPAQNPTGLELITDANFSAQSSVPVSGCFTSTYKNYRVLVSIDAVNSNAVRTINFRFRDSGGDDANAIYSYSSQMSGLGNPQFNRINSGYGTTQTVLTEHYYAANTSVACLDILNPFVSTLSSSASGIVRGGYASEDTTGTYNVFTTAKSHTGFSIYPSTGTITGSYSVYGYRD
jgi:hypothetical protein